MAINPIPIAIGVFIGVGALIFSAKNDKGRTKKDEKEVKGEKRRYLAMLKKQRELDIKFSTFREILENNPSPSKVNDELSKIKDKKEKDEVINYL